jgi:putative DNA methylase
VPASQFVPNGASDAKKKSLGRANAAKFIKNLCQYPAPPHATLEAQKHVLHAHAVRLSAETGEPVTVEDITAGRVPRPKVLDMFAGGGAIPLEALRLGCDVKANDLNPVAHMIQLCTLSYPQRFGRPDPSAAGATGAKNSNGKATWGGLAEEVRHWGQQVYRQVYHDIGDLYPPVPDPEFAPQKKSKSTKGDEAFAEPQHVMGFAADAQQLLTTRRGYLTPVAYLWTRTVPCKKPGCGAEVPLLRQTWVCKRDERYVALRPHLNRNTKKVRFEIVESETEAGIGFDPSSGSVGGSVACPFCSTVVDSEYAKQIGETKGFGVQPMVTMCVRNGETGKVYVPFAVAEDFDDRIQERLASLVKGTGLKPLDEPLEANPRSFDIHRYGFKQWRQVFTERQNLMLLTCAAKLREAWQQMGEVYEPEHRKALYTCVALTFSRLVTQHNAFAFIHVGGEKVDGPWGDGKFPMSWDFAEANPFSGVTASYSNALQWACKVYENIGTLPLPAALTRGSATELPLPDESLDAVITDPPYYDSVSYSNLSDAFYVWLKRSLAQVHPEHFASVLTPKRPEAIKAAYRHNGDDEAAARRYEEIMTASLREANRLLKPGGTIAVVYAHKTTLGWSTLVDALRQSGFTIAEAWPLATEAKGGRKKVDKAMLASSIFLIARKRATAALGNHDEQVRPELETIVRERVETLWDMGISGADLVIACVGAGLRAFTRFARVEYANGEEVPAERFLTEVETVVLETILARLSKEVGGKGTSLAGLDPATRFYILWRYTYKTAELDAGEAIIFANGTHVELDGQHSLTSGSRSLVAKKKGKYALLDFTVRGDNEDLGLPSDSAQPAPLIDALHRTLWLMEKRPNDLPGFLRDSQVSREQLRLVAQALAGPALKGGELGEVSPTAELSALGKLTANWQSVVEDAALTSAQREEKKVGQKQLI